MLLLFYFNNLQFKAVWLGLVQQRKVYCGHSGYSYYFKVMPLLYVFFNFYLDFSYISVRLITRLSLTKLKM